MAVRKIIRMGHPSLRVPAEPVVEAFIRSEQCSRLLSDMYDTLHDYGGVGLAAPQIDEPLQLAIVELPGGPTRYGEVEALPLTVFFNPRIEVLNPATAGNWEGCLSVPGMRGYVERPQHVRVDYTDVNGQPGTLELQGFAATVVQHEFDHLEGKLYIDRITDMTKLAFDEEFSRYWLRAED